MTTPFDFWWAAYSKYCPRMKNKKGCKKKFEAYDVETQKIIYADSRDRVKHFLDWQEETADGKRKCMNAPEVYLNQRMWEAPITLPKRQDNVRDTCNETVNPAQEIQGLKKLIEIIKMAGVGELAPLEAQLKKRLERI